MCPLTCKIVQSAIKAHDAGGTVMMEYIYACKKWDSYCEKCIRNEYSDVPQHFRKDMGVLDGD